MVTPDGGSLELDSYLDDKDTVEINRTSFFPNYDKHEFHTIPQPPFHKNFDLLTEDIQAKQEAGFTIYILAEQQKQLDRLRAILDEGQRTKDEGQRTKDYRKIWDENGLKIVKKGKTFNILGLQF